MAVKKKKPSSSLQLNLFAPQSDWVAPLITALPASWADAKRVALDTETRDPTLRELGPGVRRDPRSNYVVGYSFAIDGGPSFYVPLRHFGGDNVENPEAFWEYLRYQASVFTGEIVGANLSYDLDWLAQNGVVFRRARFRDVMIAEALIYELHNSYSLDSIAQRWSFPGKEEALLREAADTFGVDPKRDLWKLPARYAGLYGEVDATLPLKILRLQEAQLAEKGLQEIWDIESDLLPVLVKMRRRGVPIHWERLDKIKLMTLEQERASLDEVYHHTGHRIAVGDVWKAEALAPALESLGIQLARTAKTAAPQIDKALLGSSDHPVFRALSEARKYNKLRTTFAESIYSYQTNGRIHCTLNQLFGEREEGGLRGARFGRVSCEDPNLQQQPSRDEFAKEWRSIYLPEDGQAWACCDFSQQEPRWAAHFAHLLNLPGAGEMVRRYCEDPLTDNHQLMADITKLPRKAAKIVFLGIMYGEGGYKLCVDLGHPTVMKVRYGREVYDLDSPEGQRIADIGHKFIAAGKEGQEILDRFDQNAPFVKGLSKACEAVVKQRGYIRTVLGRHCRFPKDEHGNYDWTYRALNRLIQGSSGDQTKKAMIDVDRAGHYLTLQVHDELDLSVGNPEEGEAVGQIMREAVTATVPFRVDVECGPSWGEIS